MKLRLQLRLYFTNLYVIECILVLHPLSWRESTSFLSLERRTGYQIWLCLIMKSQWLLKANETISKKHSTTSLPTNHYQPAHYQSPTIKVTAAVAVASSPQLS